MSGFTASLYSRQLPVALLQALLKMVDGDGNEHTVHVHVAGDGGNRWNDGIEPYDVIALVFNPEMSDGTLNEKAMGLLESYKNLGKRRALVGVPRKRLSPQVQALADWVIY